jgi:tetratricopeptide (TPR) repeat protein
MLRGDGTRQPDGAAAESQFRDALLWYRANSPDNLRIAELHADLASALLVQPGRSGDALGEAEIAVRLNPLRASYREVLARAYEAGGDLHHACEAADEALLLEPDAADLHFNLAMLKWRLAESLADPELHDAERLGAIRQFNEALDLYESDERDERRTTHWWLAMSHFAMSSFHEVPPHLRFVLSSVAPDDGSAREEQGVKAVADLWLGMTYRKLGKFVEAEVHLRSAIDAVTRLERVGARLEDGLAEAMLDSRWSLGLVGSLAHMQLAGSLADRNGNFEYAKSQLRMAQTALERMRESPELHEAMEAAYSDFQAETGRLLLARGETDAAVDALQAATELDPGEADVYLLLAEAHKRAAEGQTAPEWQEHVRRARSACRRTREIGGEGHPDTNAAKAIEAELDQLEARVVEEAPRQERLFSTQPWRVPRPAPVIPE